MKFKKIVKDKRRAKMKPKVNKSEAKMTKKEPKGSKREPKKSQKRAYWSQNGAHEHPKCKENRSSEKVAKMTPKRRSARTWFHFGIILH